MSTEATSQPAFPAPTTARHTPAMTRAEVGMCPARHVLPLPSRKTTVQVLLFFSCLLKAIFKIQLSRCDFLHEPAYPPLGAF